MVLQIVFLVLQLGFVIFLLYFCIAFVSGAPFVPTQKSAAASMIALANIKKGDILYDLGSGNGKLLFLAAEKGARAIGYEINPMLVVYSNMRTFFSPYRGQVVTKWKNFWNADIHDADVIVVYLMPWKMDRLAQKIMKECKKGTVVVSNSFIFPKWKILRQDLTNHVYVFRVD